MNQHLERLALKRKLKSKPWLSSHFWWPGSDKKKKIRWVGKEEKKKLNRHENEKMKVQWTDCMILGRHFERVSLPAHVRDKYKILMADREFAVVSGRSRRLFPQSSSLSFLAAKKTLYLHPFSVVRISTQLIKTKQQSAPKNWSSQTCESEAGSSLALGMQRLGGGLVLVDLPMKGFIKT